MMRKLITLFVFFGLYNALAAQDLSYYLPDSFTYRQDVPTPESVIGHKVGEWHVTHDRLVNYMNELARSRPDRIKLEKLGTTHEGRQQLALIITSAANHQNLESIRLQHLQLSDPAQSGSLNTQNMPIVVWMGYSIHGNESSGVNASLLAAYHLAAAEGPQVQQLLDNAVILLDPSFNPDGMTRFSTWANQHKSKTLVTDPQSREFSEVWPGGRYNHYWFDLNRDWLPAVHVESRNRLKLYHQWLPNILTDHHEMGSNSSFFFQPGVPSRVNPLTPKLNQELTAKIGTYHARFLDRIGSMYFTKEGFDDFYYGKGSTFPDIHGAVGILFEQASSRGHAQETSNGLLTFPFTIRNQFVTTLSTLEAAKNMRVEMLNYQRDFYKDMAQQAGSNRQNGWIIGDANDMSKTRIFGNMLKQHQIPVYMLNRDVKAGGESFKKDGALVVPATAKNYKLLQTIFEKQNEYEDSLFYDISSWTMPMAFGLPYAPIRMQDFSNIQGAAFSENTPSSATLPKSSYAYLVNWSSFLAPKLAYQLMKANVRMMVATSPVTLNINNEDRMFSRGTLIIPLQNQDAHADTIHAMLQRAMREDGVQISATGTGAAVSGSDLGSRYMTVLEKPKPAMITGTGVNALDAGEIWHLMDQRMEIPLTHLDQDNIRRMDLTKYTHIIMPGGRYTEDAKTKLKEFVERGGIIIAAEEANTWLSSSGISKLEFKRAERTRDSTASYLYADKEQVDGSARMAGAIFQADFDPTHPLLYGYTQDKLDMIVTSGTFFKKPSNPYASPVSFGNNPLQSGYVNAGNKKLISQSAAVVVESVGSGKIIHLSSNVNFRGFWLGGTKLFMNALFFGNSINRSTTL